MASQYSSLQLNCFKFGSCLYNSLSFKDKQTDTATGTERIVFSDINNSYEVMNFWSRTLISFWIAQNETTSCFSNKTETVSGSKVETYSSDIVYDSTGDCSAESNGIQFDVSSAFELQGSISTTFSKNIHFPIKQSVASSSCRIFRST